MANFFHICKVVFFAFSSFEIIDEITFVLHMIYNHVIEKYQAKIILILILVRFLCTYLYVSEGEGNRKKL